MKCSIILLIGVLQLFGYISADDSETLLIVIRSQSNEYHNRVAIETKEKLDSDAENFGLDVKVIIMHHEWPIESAWIILPLLPSIAQKYGENFNWVMFVEENIHVNLEKLVSKVLPKYNFEDEIYLGRCLVDNQITIIHHFAFHGGGIEKFHYPDFHAGWILSQSLITRVAEKWEFSQKTDFQIDVQHEIAMYLDREYDVKMTCSNEICGSLDKEDCVTWVDYPIPDCGTAITLDNILISVKTTKKFHSSRVKIIKETWGKYVPSTNIIYYSNITDSSIPTVDCGVPNTEIGHCGKMEVIINEVHSKKDLEDFSWLVIADDDSIIGLTQLVKLLNCYKSSVPIVLGERYGFSLNTGHGYGYITGGGSMVMSRGAIKAWADHGCQCPSIDTPDDMMLGQCFSYSVGVPVVHSARFHQARPEDYSTGYISNLQPISFHKHWQVDPIKVYETYFAADDKASFSSRESTFDTAPTENKADVETYSGKDEL